MKYGIVENIVDLASCTLAVITICKNPYQELKKRNHSYLRLIQIEDEAPEGTFSAKLQQGKLQIVDGSFFGYKMIDLSKHLIQFEPDSTFEVFGTGYVHELSNPLKKEDYEGSDKAFLVFSEKEGPSTWTKGVINQNILDFGETTEVMPLI